MQKKFNEKKYSGRRYGEKGIQIRGILWLACLFFLIWGISCCLDGIGKLPGTIQICLTESIPESQASRIVRDGQNQISGQEVVWWDQEKARVICAPELDGKSINADVIRICGNSALLFEAARGSRSYFLSYEGTTVMDQNDTNECLVSEKLAYQLFGTENVIGTHLRYNEKEYSIIGTFPAQEIVFACEVTPDDEKGLSRASIDNRKGKSSTYVMEQYAAQWGDGSLVDQQWITFLLRGFCSIIQIIILTVFLMRIKAFCPWRERKDNCRKDLFLILTVGVVFVIICLIKSAYLPADYFSGISDRELWIAFSEEKRAAFDQYLSVEKTFWEVIRVKKMLRVILLLSAELAVTFGFWEFMAAGNKSRRRKAKKQFREEAYDE